MSIRLMLTFPISRLSPILRICPFHVRVRAIAITYLLSTQRIPLCDRYHHAITTPQFDWSEAAIYSRVCFLFPPFLVRSYLPPTLGPIRYNHFGLPPHLGPSLGLTRDSLCASLCASISGTIQPWLVGQDWPKTLRPASRVPVPVNSGFRSRTGPQCKPLDRRDVLRT
ncbi:hypothetical protein EDB85DRAFT_1920646 [Lactarius pseudohatsudake]|nr:hypothetical protein EDB85DRAFT_1920646 [Lactarius pseudohatsudake]